MLDAPYRMVIRDDRGETTEARARTLRDVARVLARERLGYGNAVEVRRLRLNRSGRVQADQLSDKERKAIAAWLPEWRELGR